jgi:alkanesulfonate monooxygenase SsuD/methylene tetrahydromethanopterin reductase-like flavin-dependent oxidoreductase (luciferase family)
VVNRGTGVDAVLRAAQEAEALGLGAAWLTNGGPEDCIPLLAAIALQTHRLKLGTSVVQTYPRHPVVLAAEANVIDQLAPGRLRLGVGPSHDIVMASLGIRREAPFAQLREYVSVVRSLARGGQVDFAGAHYQVHTGFGRPFNVPIMIGALQRKTFELAGRETDGAITWLCPADYLAAVGLPALERGAADAGRARPPLIAHVAACVHDNADEVREAVRRGIPNIGFPAYQRMLVAAGLDEAAGAFWTDDLVDRVIAWGSPDRVAGRIEEMFEIGADEVLIRPIGAGPAPDAVVTGTIEAIAGSF